MRAEKLIADRISDPAQNKGNISGPIVKIGIIGISTGICVMLLTVSIVLGFKREIENKITGLTSQLNISSVNLNASSEAEPITIGKDTLSLVKKIPGIQHIQAVAFKNGLLKTDTENEGILFKGVNADFDFSYLKKHLQKGRIPDLKEPDAGKDILVSESLCRRLGLDTGQRLQVYFISQHAVLDSASGEIIEKSEQRSRRFTVCGIFKTDFQDFDDRLCIVDLRHIQKLNYWGPDVVGNYEIRIRDFNADQIVIERLQDLFGYEFNIRSARETYSNIFTWLEKLDVNGIIIVVLMVLVATVNMITALLILILERANMVGLLKCLGLSNASLRGIFMRVSLRLTAKGLWWGNLIGIGLCLLQYHFKLVGLDSSTYYVDHVAIEINWLYFMWLNLGTLLVCTTMLLFPTMLLGKLTPLRSLRID